jgi:hypothetical protein
LLRWKKQCADIMAETDGPFKYVATPNVHHMVLEDPATMQPLYERAWRVFCDSRVLSRLAWFTCMAASLARNSTATRYRGRKRIVWTMSEVGPL